jgi:hypothetical protein
MAVTGEFVMTDDTGAVELLRIAVGGARVGVNGAPDGSHILTVNGSTIIKSNGFAFTATVIPTSAGPVVGSVSVVSGGTTTVSTGLTQAVIPTAGVGTDVSSTSVDSLNSSNFVLRNNGGGTETIHYAYW